MYMVSLDLHEGSAPTQILHPKLPSCPSYPYETSVMTLRKAMLTLEYLIRYTIRQTEPCKTESNARVRLIEGHEPHVRIST